MHVSYGKKPYVYWGILKRQGTMELNLTPFI